MTWGSQKCKGEAPIFKARDEIRITITKFMEFKEWLKNITKEAKISIIEARAWVIKYLMEASVHWGFILLMRIGINLIKLISNPNQAVNQEEEEHAMKVPVAKVKK
jgi:hypothetical protein